MKIWASSTLSPLARPPVSAETYIYIWPILFFFCCSRVSLNHLYGPSFFEKWLSPEEEDTQIASQEEEEEELFSARALHALLYRPRQQRWFRRRERPLWGQRVSTQQHHGNQRPRCWRSRHRSVSCHEACGAIRDPRISGGLLQVLVVTERTCYLGGPGEEPFVSCSCQTNSTTGPLPNRWCVCDCAHTCACAWLHQRLHRDGRHPVRSINS